MYLSMSRCAELGWEYSVIERPAFTTERQQFRCLLEQANVGHEDAEELTSLCVYALTRAVVVIIDVLVDEVRFLLVHLVGVGGGKFI